METQDGHEGDVDNRGSSNNNSEIFNIGEEEEEKEQESPMENNLDNSNGRSINLRRNRNRRGRRRRRRVPSKFILFSDFNLA